MLGGGFECPNRVFLTTNNSDIERLFGAPFGAFNTTNSGDINGGIKEEFENVVAPYISVYSATIENQLGGAFLSSIIGLNMIKLFQAPATNPNIIYDNDFIGSADQSPAPNIASFNYHFDFKREREIEVKGFEYGVGCGIGVPLIIKQYGVLKIVEKDKRKRKKRRIWIMDSNMAQQYH